MEASLKLLRQNDQPDQPSTVLALNDSDPFVTETLAARVPTVGELRSSAPRETIKALGSAPAVVEAAEPSEGH